MRRRGLRACVDAFSLPGCAQPIARMADGRVPCLLAVARSRSVAAQFPKLKLAHLSLNSLDVVVQVRVFWHVQGSRMKVAIVPDSEPELNLDVALNLLCCCVPSALFKTAGQLALKQIAGRYFDVDLSSTDKAEATVGDEGGQEAEDDSDDEEEEEKRGPESASPAAPALASSSPAK